ncbi:ABC transporter ATP-binding protein [Corynebacterium choanae]|uniref:Sulfate/thiosulfate import ATP-binding protein CysA n=1 Tax=Corynebacterium choanae TaxID=1862358 RepID=A0A3G6J327_9CORY|nr:ABC transporter ATP-binding protein [Corynebacterium choanae]AZA12471.1 Sulfate/thiosulfate import ATP-binding protein CysA [Corynebacterium choanae]
MTDIVVSGITFAYPGSTSPQLAGFSLTAPAGQCTALLGPSGCAKTTVLRLIAGLERPQQGSITIGGTTMVDEHHFIAPERRKVGFIFQDYALFPHMTVAANVGYGLRKVNKRTKQVVVRDTLELVGLAGMDDRYPHQLSGGQQQRVALARALAPAPDVLLFDEPFSNLDADLRAQVRADIRSLIEDAGVTAMLVTHDMADAEVLADTTITMHPPAATNS